MEDGWPLSAHTLYTHMVQSICWLQGTQRLLSQGSCLKGEGLRQVCQKVPKDCMHLLQLLSQLLTQELEAIPAHLHATSCSSK